MKRVLAVVAGAAALVLVGCGADSKSCSSAPAHLASVSAGCTFAPASRVTVMVRALCESCAHTDPICEGELLAADLVELNPTFRECAEDLGCPNTGSCPFGTFPCTFTTPAASGPLEIQYPTNAVGGLASVTVNVAAGGTTNCSTIALHGEGELTP